MVALGALVGLWVLRRELARSHLPESGVDAAIAGVIGGMVGAKLLWVLEHLGEEPFADLALSRGGMSWFGGFAGGILAGLWFMQRKRLPKIAVLAAATPRWRSATRSDASGASLSATITDVRRTSRGPWLSHRGCLPRSSPSIRRSSTKRPRSCPSHGCCSDGGGKAVRIGSSSALI